MSNDAKSPGGANPVTRGLIHSALEALVDEIAITVSAMGVSHRTSNQYDFSCGIFDRRGQILAQGAGLPAATSAIPDTMEVMLRMFGDDIEPGDVFLTNDPYEGGTHLPDFFMFRPIFFEDALVGFSAIYSHHVDIGGRVAGGQAHDSTEIYQEGLRLPPLKIYRRGVANDDVQRIIEANVRDPKAVLGDMRAQHGACIAGERGLLKLIERFGAKELEAYTDDLLEYAERLTRAEIARWPDGDYEFTDYVDGDAMGSELLPIQITMRVRGDSLTVDFSGTQPQLRSSINATRSWTKGIVHSVLRLVMEADIPYNHGFFRPIEIVTPRGSIVDCELPAAVGNRVVTAVRVADTTFGALEKVLPGKIIAGCDGSIGAASILGRDDSGKPFFVYDSISNAWGGRPTKDGIDGLGLHIANTANTPIEQWEAHSPVRVEEYSLVPDTGGAGKYRGGLGVARSWRFLADEGEVHVRSQRWRLRPFGWSGGREGTFAQWTLTGADGREEPMPGIFARPLRRGELLRHQTPGAGGWGNPYERDVDAVLADVKEGKVTVEHARLEYGVEINADTLEIDTRATDELRRQMAADAKGRT